LTKRGNNRISLISIHLLSIGGRQINRKRILSLALMAMLAALMIRSLPSAKAEIPAWIGKYGEIKKHENIDHYVFRLRHDKRRGSEKSEYDLAAGRIR